MKSQALIILLFFSMTSFSQSFDELGKKYSQGNINYVIEKGKELLSSNPDEPLLNMLVGRSLTDKGNYIDAIPLLINAANSETEKKWINSWSHGYLGICYFMVGQYENSKKALEKTLDLNTTRNSNNYALKRTFLFGTDKFYKDWTTDSTKQIIFHFQNEGNLEKELFMLRGQFSLEKILQKFPAVLSKKIDFFVWESEQDAKRILRTNLGFSNPNYLITHSRKNQTSGHELTHIIVQHSIHPKSKSRFINEGIATLLDQTNKNRLEIAQKVLLKYNRNISIEDLWKNGKNYPESIIYPIGAAWMEYCSNTLSKEQFHTILVNQSFEDAQNLLSDNLTNAIKGFEQILLNN